MTEVAYLITYEPVNADDMAEPPIVIARRPPGHGATDATSYDPDKELRNWIAKLGRDPAVDPKDIRIWKLTEWRVREEKRLVIDYG